MEVTKVKITRNYVFNKRVYKKGSEFYVSDAYRNINSSIDCSDIFDADGNRICFIKGHWFDFAGKKLFLKID